MSCYGCINPNNACAECKPKLEAMTNRPTDNAGETRDGLIAAKAVLERVYSELGEAIHTGLRKAADSPESVTAWQAISNMPDWTAVIDFATEGLNLRGALRAVDKAIAQQAVPCYECGSTEMIDAARADAIPPALQPAVSEEAVEAATKAMTAWAQPDRDMNDQFWVIDRGKRVKAFVDRDDAVEACDALNARAALTAALPFMMAKTDLEKTD